MKGNLSKSRPSSAGTVSGAELKNGTILTDKIADGAIINRKLADGAVTESKIADNSITIDKLADTLRRFFDYTYEIIAQPFEEYGCLECNGSTATFNSDYTFILRRYYNDTNEGFAITIPAGTTLDYSDVPDNCTGFYLATHVGWHVDNNGIVFDNVKCEVVSSDDFTNEYVNVSWSNKTVSFYLLDIVTDDNSGFFTDFQGQTFNILDSINASEIAKINNKVDNTQYASHSQTGIVKLRYHNGKNYSGIKDLGDGVIQINANASKGLTISGSNELITSPASETDIEEGANKYKPIVPANLEYAVESVTGKKSELNTEDKTSLTAAINEINAKKITANQVMEFDQNYPYCLSDVFANQEMFDLCTNGKIAWIYNDTDMDITNTDVAVFPQFDSVISSSNDGDYYEITGATSTLKSGHTYLVTATAQPYKQDTNWYPGELTVIADVTVEKGVANSDINYSTTPQRVGTWIDGTPIWRAAINYELSDVDLENIQESNGEHLLRLPVNDNNQVALINEFVVQGLESMCIVDDQRCKYTASGIWMIPDVTNIANANWLHGWVEFATAEENLNM